jgi:SPP1 family predicted phage head-tail adaptor
MPQRSGAFRHFVTIQEATITRSAMGAEVKTWGELDQVWADIRPGSGREDVSAQQDWSTVAHIVRIRFRTDVTPKMRIIFGSRLFEIQAVVDPTGRREVIDLISTEELDTITAA